MAFDICLHPQVDESDRPDAHTKDTAATRDSRVTLYNSEDTKVKLKNFGDHLSLNFASQRIRTRSPRAKLNLIFEFLPNTSTILKSSSL